VGECPRLRARQFALALSLLARGERTHKGDDVVKKRQPETVDGKIKDVSPVRVVRFLPELVVCNHDAGCDEVRKDAASEDDQDILGDPSPRRVAGAEERGLPEVIQLASKKQCGCQKTVTTCVIL
jgi:hypothetical protein